MPELDGASQSNARENIERPLSAHRLAQYVARNRCERYLRLVLHPSEGLRLRERYGVGFESLSPLLSGEGQSFERGKIEELKGRGESVVDLTNKSEADFVRALKRQPQGRVYYYQPSIAGRIGGWRCGGRADLIEVTRRPDGAFACLVLDIKASPRETVGFRLQVAFYAVLLEELLRAEGLRAEAVRGAIAARDDEFVPGEWRTFDLALFRDEIDRLIAAHDSDVARAASVSFESASYHLGRHCDGCPYNAICFVDTAEREDLSLVPHLTATEKRALQSEGVSTARALAGLMVYAGHDVVVARGCEAQVARVGARWPLGSRLPVLAQRARAALARHDRSIEHRRMLYGANWGSLPDENSYPGLVKIFIDAQRDHIKDRLYLLAALVSGPRGAFRFVKMTASPPEIDDERALLMEWLREVLPAVGRVADSSDAPVHVYLYDRRGQRSLLDALARHFDALCAIPAFYDLLTSSPALTQSMISFLGDEVSERHNLGAVCCNLYEVSSALGFKWRDTTGDLYERFRVRVFDNRRPYMRDESSRLFSLPEEKAGPDALWVESAARFGTEIPLEYAYAAWGELDETEELKREARTQLRGFLGTTREEIEALASVRLDALRHIEESFRYKNRQVEKLPLDLSRIDRVEIDPDAIPLRRALEDFLLLEHYASFQELMLHFSLPPELRVETGRTAVIRCESFDRDRGTAVFDIACADGATGADASAATVKTGVLRFREGDWRVLNPLADEETGAPLTGKRLVHGRLCVVEEITERSIKLRLMKMSFKNSNFRFGHRMIEPSAGQLYTLDEMADDLNSDKFLEACRNAESNQLYLWLDDLALGLSRRDWIRPSRLRTAGRVAELADAAEAPHGLTDAQREVIGAYLAERMFVLQGPPGTGKSHTLGFAAISRALALATPARPFRILVCAKTHAAVEVALSSIRARADKLASFHAKGVGGETETLLAPLARMRVVKVVNDASANVPQGVEPLSADGDGRMKAPEQWAVLMREPLLVVGCTPGGLYNLVKRGASKGREIDWSAEYFDLVLVDEASQMGLAEALMSAAFLRADGQFIAIGDHRQMPPILAHAWDQDSRRELERIRPHLSVFDYMRESGAPRAALEESFRVPREVAEFLGRHVYAADGVAFHSRTSRRLEVFEETDGSDAWLEAALDPEHPLIVVEHSETGSQQENAFEASLVAEVLRVASQRFGLDARKGAGIVVPHRAQKFLLREMLPEFSEAIDTVERFQGGERDLIVVSATVSDREFAAAESEFLLDPRRFTVAVSRPRCKVVVIASRAVFDLLPSDLDEYERGCLWKHLRHEAESRLLWQGRVDGRAVSVRAALSTA